MEEQHITMMVILDLSVAFDMVDHGKSWKTNLGLPIQHSDGSTITSDQDHSKYAYKMNTENPTN